MRYPWLGSCLLATVACSNGRFPVGGRQESARAPATAMVPVDSLTGDEAGTDRVVDEALTKNVAVDSAAAFQAWVEREQPGVVLRCEDGRLGAYLVTPPSGPGERDTIPRQEVRIALDSAPRC